MPTILRPANSHTVVATGWTNPSNAFAIEGDDVYATALNNGTAKNLSHSGDFGFANILSDAIPDGADILEARLVAEVNLTTQVPGGTFGLQGALSGTLQDGEATKTGAGEDLVTFTFPTPPTLSQLRSASTVVRARCRGSKGNTANALTVQMDYVRLEVDYEVPAEPQEYERFATDTHETTESPVRTLSASRLNSDSVSLSEQIDHVHTPAAADEGRTAVDTVSLSDQIDHTHTPSAVGEDRTAIDTVALFEQIDHTHVAVVHYEVTAEDTVATTDEVEHSHAGVQHYEVTAGDTVATTDEIAPTEGVQTATAVSDVAIDGWTGEDDRTTDLYTSVAGVNDATYAKSPGSPNSTHIFEVRLGPLDPPSSNEGHILRYRYSGNGLADLVVDLVQGSTVIASWTHPVPDEAVAQATQTLSAGEVAAITDYSDLRLRFRGA